MSTVPWTSSLDPLRDYLRGHAPANPRWIVAETWDDTLVLLSLRQGAALTAQPDPDTGEWRWQFWRIPSSSEADLDPFIGMSSSRIASSARPLTSADLDGELPWMRLRLEVALADDTTPDASGTIAATAADPSIPTARPWITSEQHPTPATTVLTALHGVLIEQRIAVAIPDLFTVVPGMRLTSAGGAVPFQAWGTWHDYRWYFRFRGSYASLSVSPTDPVGVPYWEADCMFSDIIVDVFDFAHLFTYLGNRLGRADFTFTFTNGVRDQHVTARTVEDAWLRLSPTTSEPDLPWRLVADDTRIWPSVEPEFTVLRVLEPAREDARADSDPYWG